MSSFHHLHSKSGCDYPEGKRAGSVRFLVGDTAPAIQKDGEAIAFNGALRSRPRGNCCKSCVMHLRVPATGGYTSAFAA